MIWDKYKTFMAAEDASRLSELIEQEGLFEQGALRWLESRQLNKFLAAIDAAETARLSQLAASWGYPAHDDSNGLPLLDWLWALDPDRRLEPEYFGTTKNVSSIGRKLVGCLAEFNYEWVARWWEWRCTKGRGNLRVRNIYHDSSFDGLANDAVIDALAKGDVQRCLPGLRFGLVAAVIGRRPDLIEALPEDRRGPILRLALEEEPKISDFIGEMSKVRLYPDPVTVIDNILDSTYESDAIKQLDEIVRRWQGPPNSDPVTMAMQQGHERLATLLRSPWQLTKSSFQSRGDARLWNNIWRGSVGRAFAAAANTAPNLFRLELGYSVGLRIAEEEAEPSPANIVKHLSEVGVDLHPRGVNALSPMVELWSLLRTLAKYQQNSWQHETELVGLRAKVVSLAGATPDLWAQSLPWVLARASTLGDITQAVTFGLASSSPEVRAALESACNDEVEEIRLKAAGLRVLLLGLEEPDPSLAVTLADAAALYMDGSPVFPHPLEPISLTWLGSVGVERAIADGVRRAADRFAVEVRDQGADIEEALTKALLKELEVEFRGVRPRLEILGRSNPRSAPPILSVRQRPSSKKLEEPVYGCDIAWLLKATVRGRYALTWADLVQVKKSSALQQRSGNALRSDSWKIECKQLDDILRWSATASYWLIASGGEVMVIPAKHLLAIRLGTKGGASLKTFTIGYHQVRSAAIPLQQYLTQLLIGQWVGTSAEEVVSFASGENSNIRPRVVFEVTIDIGPENR
jgi:hypothetical protein